MSNKCEGDNEANRTEFLFHMYDQMFNDINRHMGVVWQPITVLIGSFGLIVAASSKLISIDIASALIVALVGWLMAILYDSSYWYNRNLVIIANIERQFLKKSDLEEIHYYFGEHRKSGTMIDHIRIQWFLAILIGTLILLNHLFTEVIPRWPTPFTLEQVKHALPLTLPWVTAIGVLILIILLRKHYINSYDEFLKNSPGIEVDTEGIVYKYGHPINTAKPRRRK